MSGFFNFLKNLFSGLLGIFGLGSQKATEGQPKRVKRSSGYFLELDDAKGVSSIAAKPAEISAPAQAQPAAVTQPAAAAAEPVATKAKAKTAKAAKAESAPAESAKPTPAALAQALNLPQPKVNFATTYLVPGNDSTARRRPGANMNSFLDMAKKVKTQS